MSAGSLAKLTSATVVELENPRGGDSSAHGELSIKEADGAETLVRMKVELWTVSASCDILASGAGD